MAAALDISIGELSFRPFCFFGLPNYTKVKELTVNSLIPVTLIASDFD